MKTRGIARLGMLAVGLGLGAGWAHMPVASADSSSDAASLIDSLLSGVSASDVTPADMNLAISYNGVSLVSDGNATATTEAGEHGLAIAYGDGASATAEGGNGDYALADGTDALAKAGSTAAGATGFNYDKAIDIGSNPDPSSIDGAPDGAYAGGGSLIGGTDSGASSHDTAIDIGSNSGTGADGGNSGAFAGDASLIGSTGAGNYDTATEHGDLAGFGLGPAAVAGDYDKATDSGDATGTNLGALAGFGNHDTASVVGGTSSATAGGDYGGSYLGSHDIAKVLDPSGVTGSYADAGASPTADGNFDLSTVFGDGLNSTSATGGNFLYDILTPLHDATSAAVSAAGDGGGFFAELASLF